tara:strand:- start:358 stop:1335 length:978 start_codon:yes stop_codon:yes gene_type:complete
MNTCSALSIVLNHHNSELIENINKRKHAEKQVQKIIDDFIEYLELIFFYLTHKDEANVWRRLYEMRPSLIIKKSIDEWERLNDLLTNQKLLARLLDDSTIDSTQLTLMMNMVYMTNCKNEMIDDYLKHSNTVRKTKCCGKVLNNKCCNHFSYFTMLEDKQKDIDTNSCKYCRPAWRPDDEYVYPEKKERCREPLYNCFICEMRYKLWFRFIILLNDTACDIGIDRKYHMPYCIYKDYSHEELETAGISAINRGTTYFENLAAHNSDEHLNISHTLFTPFLPESDDEGDDKYENETEEEERKRCDEEEAESYRLWSLDKNDVSDVI